MKQDKTITCSQKKKVILEELRYLTYYEPYSDQGRTGSYSRFRSKRSDPERI